MRTKRLTEMGYKESRQAREARELKRLENPTKGYISYKYPVEYVNKEGESKLVFYRTIIGETTDTFS